MHLPGTIPGLSAGTHTMLLTRDGYQDLSTPVTIAAGKTQDYTTAMAKNAGAAESPATTANATASSRKTPGFEFTLAFAAMGVILALRKGS